MRSRHTPTLAASTFTIDGIHYYWPHFGSTISAFNPRTSRLSLLSIEELFIRLEHPSTQALP